MKVACGQIWKLINDKKYYGVGKNGDLIIILSLKDKNVWRIGCFWAFGIERGGARQRDFTETELNEIAEYVGDINQLKEETK